MLPASTVKAMQIIAVFRPARVAIGESYDRRWRIWHRSANNKWIKEKTPSI
jgi:hypothetical protein